MRPRGAYPADRAAALSGVPWSTVHEWARKGVLAPSISEEKPKRWSYADLMGLRLVYWLRHPKLGAKGRDVPAASMTAVRRALDALRDLERELWIPEAPPSVAVDRAGRIVLNPAGDPEDLTGQMLAGDPDTLDLVLPFVTLEGTRGRTS